jgi:hypothetical protein
MMTETDKERNVNWADRIVQKLKMGEELEWNFDVDGVLEVYQKVEVESAREKIVAFGSALLKAGWLRDGLKAYKLAGMKPPKMELISCGDAILEKALEDISKGYCLGYPVNHALAAYKLAGTIPTEKFIAVGDALVKKYNLLAKCPPCDRSRQQALKAYFVAIKALIKEL